MREIERRFLIDNLESLDLSKYEKKTITQAYLYSDKYTAVRKRKIEENGKNTYIYTVKTRKGDGYGKEEIENNLSKEEFDSLKIPENTNIIIKDRYIIPIENNLKIELDIFKGIFEGIVYAEVEFPSEEMAKNYVEPDWFGREISSNISNSMMAKSSRKDIEKKIKQ